MKPNDQITTTKPKEVTETVSAVKAADVIEAMEAAFPYLKGQFKPTEAFQAYVDQLAIENSDYEFQHFVNLVGAVCHRQVKARSKFNEKRQQPEKPPTWDSVGLKAWNADVQGLAAVQQASGNKAAAEATEAYYKLSPEEREQAAAEARAKLGI